jgi:Mrp family chromosome partitioning ATPase
MRRRNAYSRAIDAIYRDLRARLGRGARAPVVAVVGAGPQAGATTLALSLAHAACNAGERALLIERDGARSELALLAGETRARAAPGLRGSLAVLRGSLAVLRRHDVSGGEILCLPGQDEIDVEAALDAAGAVDLVLIDHGAPARADRLLRELRGADGAVLAASPDADQRDLAPLRGPLDASGLLLATVATGAGEGGG